MLFKAVLASCLLLPLSSPAALGAAFPQSKKRGPWVPVVPTNGHLWLPVPHCRFSLMTNWEEEFNLFSLPPRESSLKIRKKEKWGKNPSTLVGASLLLCFLFSRFSWKQESFFLYSYYLTGACLLRPSKASSHFPKQKLLPFPLWLFLVTVNKYEIAKRFLIFHTVFYIYI